MMVEANGRPAATGRNSVRVFVRLGLLVLALATVAKGCSCDPGAGLGLAGPTNAQLTFYGQAVDQDGRPLSGVKFVFVMSGPARGWSITDPGRSYDHAEKSVTSGPDGRFSFNGKMELLKLKSTDSPGYDQFNDLYVSEEGAFNSAFRVTDFQHVTYQTDPQNPAIYVFVKRGMSVTRALPSGGGAQLRGLDWIVNKPTWPRTPSLPNVTRALSSTKPTSAP